MSTDTQRYTETLPVKLTESEALERADVSARLQQERDAIEAAMKADAAQRKADIQEKDAAMRRLAEEIRQRRTYRAVDCERRFDYSDGKVREVRLDTGEIISERDMTYDERQRKLDLDEKKAKRDQPPKRSEKVEREADEEGRRMAGGDDSDESSAAEEAAKKVRTKRAKRGS
jgi:hypothetical protein